MAGHSEAIPPWEGVGNPEMETRLGIAEQRAKAFFLEGAVIGEGFGQTLAAHGLHRNAIDQAIALVGAGSIEL